MRLLVATRNPGKLVEIRRILSPIPKLEVLSPDDIGLHEVAEEEGIESFATFEENARAKALWFHARADLPVVADDSGLEVEALGGKPGVHSRRFAPEAYRHPGEAQGPANVRFLLEALSEIPPGKRTARFVCVACAVGVPELAEGALFRGESEGRILPAPRGTGGFGYDPVFGDESLNLSYAELSPAQKGERSHRGRAFRHLLEAWPRVGPHG